MAALLMTSMNHDDSPALGNDSTWTPGETHHDESSAYLPRIPGYLPFMIYLSTDFPSGPMDNSAINMMYLLQAAHRGGIPIVRWEPRPNGLDGRASFVDPTNSNTEIEPADLDVIRNWAGGVALVVRWPDNDRMVQAAEIVFTGAYGVPHIIRDVSNARLHLHDQIAGYGSGIHYASRRRGA